ncbi:PRC-barrel domain-containing protein [uncultured Gelidibacter sp.]|uniref:PRC-barrel domain-containing protein n=1 Tax=uncultured Gelidibacter sp. TaxID=259318 RepID=UPI002610243B|nr:PRC-barrel domain-containing protein [uncultured Gelidibacter sp.]
MAEQDKHLYYITELSDYKISDGYPDVRGWDVKDVDNRVIGKVDNLLVNKYAERVVYLDVEVDKSIIDAKHDPYGRPTQTEIREFVNKEGENHIIVPIGLVDVNEDSKYIYTDIIDHRTFSETKRYRKGDNINRSYENQVLNSYERRQNWRDTDDVNVVSNDSHLYDDNRVLDENRFTDTRRFDDNDNDLVDDNNLVDDENFRDRVQRQDNYLQDEDRLREIIREEIRKYHYDANKLETYGTAEDSYPPIDDNQVFSNDEKEMRLRRENNDVYDNDNFYKRREFDDRRFNRRTPGL